MAIKSRLAKERFWEKVQKDSDDKCWKWIGGKFSNGYGQFYKNPCKITAHRFSYELANGEIDKNLKVCHTCDNPICVNPNHLFVGTQKDNIQDMIKKKRHNFNDAIGINNGRSIVNEVEVKEIRQKYKEGNISYKKLAKKYNLSETQTMRIVKRESWKHIN